MAPRHVKLNPDESLKQFVKRCVPGTISITLDGRICLLKQIMGAIEYICSHPKSFRELKKICLLSIPAVGQSNTTDLSFLQPLESLQSLRELDIEHCGSCSLSGLASLQSLQRLTVSSEGNHEIDLVGIEFLADLRFLCLNRGCLKNLSLINELSELQALTMCETSVEDDLDLSGLVSLRELTSTCLKFQSIMFSPDARPTHIIIEGVSKLSQIVDLNPSKLVMFVSPQSELTSLEFLKGARLLKILDVTGNPLEDLSQVPVTSLKHVFLGMGNNDPKVLRTAAKGKKTFLEIAYLSIINIEDDSSTYDRARENVIDKALRSRKYGLRYDDVEEDEEEEEEDEGY